VEHPAQATIASAAAKATNRAGGRNPAVTHVVYHTVCRASGRGGTIGGSIRVGW
jgi:hypothetical protein